MAHNSSESPATTDHAAELAGQGEQVTGADPVIVAVLVLEARKFAHRYHDTNVPLGIWVAAYAGTVVGTEAWEAGEIVRKELDEGRLPA
jgi:hypothetical protein